MNENLRAHLTDLVEAGHLEREREALAAYERGWCLTPLRGKKPILEAWQKQPRPTEKQIREWAAKGNLGVRTGSASGIAVVDAEAGSDVTPLELPETVTAITGGGGRHYYYRINGGPPIGNSSGKLGPKIDFKAECGQVVLAGSIHPDTGKPYQWAPGLSPDDCEIAPLPDRIAERLAAPKPRPAAKVSNRANGYARAAFDAELEAVRNAPDGTGNDQLNTSAFKLGQLIGAGLLDEADVTAALLEAATLRRSEAEARATIHSGTEAGKLQPRDVPALKSRSTRVVHRGDAANELPEVLTTGPHETDNGIYIEIGNDDFVRAALEAIPQGELYVSGGVLGEIAGEPGARRFLPGTENRVRTVIDRHARLTRWIRPRGKNAQPEQIFEAATRDHAALVMASAGLDGIGPAELKGIINAPTMREDGSLLDRPGYDTATMLLYDPGNVSFPTIPANPTKDDAFAAYLELAEPFVEFSFVDQRVGIAAIVSAELTLLVRHAIADPCPLFAARAATPGSGKDLLVKAICAAGIGREPKQDNVPTGRDADNEIKKSILAYAIEQVPAVLFGNVDRPLGSASLADALTKTSISSRLLGFTRTAEAPLRIVWFATGNGLTFKGDLGRRVLPIDLYSIDEHPEDREGPVPGKKWTHPELVDYVRRERPRFVAAALTLVRAFHVAGRPGHGRPLKGSFEAWDRLIRAAVIWAGGADPLDACQIIREEGVRFRAIVGHPFRG